MRKTVWMTAMAVVAIAAMAVAGQMTTQELTMKVANCPSCKAMANYPELGTNLRPDIFETSNGYVSTFLMADAKYLPVCAKWEQDCQTIMGDAAKMSRADFEKKFCPVCVGMGDLMGRKDVKMESFNGSMGKVTVATSTTPEGVTALHAMVKTMNEAKAVMPQAFAEMMKTSKSKTASTGE